LSQLTTQHDIGAIVLLACNGGHLDYNNNVAMQLLNHPNINVQTVVASDGATTRIGNATSFWSAADKEWRKQNTTNRSSNSGFVVFAQNSNGIVTQTPLGHTSFFTQKSLIGLLKEANLIP